MPLSLCGCGCASRTLLLPAGRYRGPPPAAAPPAGDARALQMRAAAAADLQQQFGDQVLPGGGHCGGDGGLEGGGYAAEPWSHGLSSDADYYGPAMVG